ncbi:MAG: hypothetical protein R3A47_04210 [Polyangiales bacterium]
MGFYAEMFEATGAVYRCFVTAISTAGVRFDSVTVPAELLGATVRLRFDCLPRRTDSKRSAKSWARSTVTCLWKRHSGFLSIAVDDEAMLRRWIAHEHELTVRITAA